MSLFLIYRRNRRRKEERVSGSVELVSRDLFGFRPFQEQRLAQTSSVRSSMLVYSATAYLKRGELSFHNYSAPSQQRRARGRNQTSGLRMSLKGLTCSRMFFGRFRTELSGVLETLVALVSTNQNCGWGLDRLLFPRRSFAVCT